MAARLNTDMAIPAIKPQFTDVMFVTEGDRLRDDNILVSDERSET
jgi:hypothetical protein